jgi:hypothetical protein
MVDDLQYEIQRCQNPVLVRENTGVGVGTSKGLDPSLSGTSRLLHALLQELLRIP